MSEGARPHQVEPPIDADLGAWAAGEISHHEEVCGIRYEQIAKDMGAMKLAMEAGLEAANARSKAIEDKISGAIKWVMGIVASLAVALILMFLNDAKTRAQADESDKRELRARLSLLTAQLAAVQPRAPLVIAPPGTQATAVTPTPVPPLDPDELNAAAGGDKGK